MPNISAGPFMPSSIAPLSQLHSTGVDYHTFASICPISRSLLEQQLYKVPPPLSLESGCSLHYISCHNCIHLQSKGMPNTESRAVKTS